MNQELLEVPALNVKSAGEYESKAIELTGQVTSLVIKDQESYEGAAGLLKTIKAMSNDAETARKKITTPLDAAKSAVMDLFRPIATRLENSERHVKGLMIAYTNEQERIRKQKEEKLQKEAAEKEAAEKKRLAARADKAEASGNTEKAEELRQKAQDVFIPPPVVAPTVQKVAGVSMKQNWKARVIDANKVPRNYMIVNEPMLDKLAKATKGSLSIEGVEFYAEDVLASR